MFLKKRKEERRRREAEAAAAARWMGTFAHPQVEVDPDARSTPECKVVRIVGDEGAAAFVPAFLEPRNSTGVRELHVLGDNPLRGITADLTPAGLQLLGSAAATLPTLVLFKISDVKMGYEGAMALCNALRTSASLETVVLWKCRLDDFTASHVVPLLLQLPRIRTINLGQNVLTADGKTFLENNAKAANPYIDLRMF